MFRKFLYRTESKTQAPPSGRVPEDLRVYAIGDIHGRNDLLEQLLAKIAADRRAAGDDRKNLLIYLGDYIDRGAGNREVIERVKAPHEMVEQVVTLRGNHEQALLDFIDDPLRARYWLDYGGLTTLMSYGVTIQAGLTGPERLLALGRQLDQNLPLDHRTFLQGLPVSLSIGDYFFAHAGIDPSRAIDDQDDEDLMNIRSPFLEWGQRLEKIIVHGHTISADADFLPWRIGIDTGAYRSGHLTCLVLEGDRQRILST